MVPLGSVEPINKLSEKDTMVRMREALKRWQEGGWDYLLVTGGAFTSKKIMTIPGSRVMAQWFLAKAVPSDRLIVEDQSRDTYQNVEFSLATVKACGFSPDQVEITVVTHWQHAIRFWLTFRSYGISANLIKLHYPVGIIGSIREYVYISLHALDPKGRLVGWLNRKLFRQNR